MAFDYVGSLQPYLSGAQGGGGSLFGTAKSMFGGLGPMMGPPSLTPALPAQPVAPSAFGSPIGAMSQPAPALPDQSGGQTGGNMYPGIVQPPDATTPSSAAPSGPDMPQPAGVSGTRNATGTQGSNVPPSQGSQLPLPPPTRPAQQNPQAPTQLNYQDLNSILPYLPQLMRQWSGDLYNQGPYGPTAGAFPVMP
jgi:hypothetical protein